MVLLPGKWRNEETAGAASVRLLRRSRKRLPTRHKLDAVDHAIAILVACCMNTRLTIHTYCCRVPIKAAILAFRGPDNGLQLLLNGVAARAKAYPVAYGHWYIDGGQQADHSPSLTCVSYQALEPVRAALLRKMQTEIQRPGMGRRNCAPI